VPEEPGSVQRQRREICRCSYKFTWTSFLVSNTVGRGITLCSIHHYNIKYYDGCSCAVVITWEAYSFRHSFAAFFASTAFVAEFAAIFELHPPKLHLCLLDRLLFSLVVEPLSVDRLLKIFYLCLQDSNPTLIMFAVGNLFLNLSRNMLKIGMSTPSQFSHVLVMLRDQLACRFSDTFFQLSSQLNCQFSNVMVMLTSQFSIVTVMLTSQFSNVTLELDKCRSKLTGHIME
jgi:hypothetical protein